MSYDIFREDNTKADILLRKDQVNTKEDNKDVQLLKDEMWTRKTMVKITMLGQKVMMEESDIIKKIRKNNKERRSSLKHWKRKMD